MPQWGIEQIAQVILQLQVGSVPPRQVLDGEIVGRGIDAQPHRAGFILQVELADAVHQGLILALPALFQQRLGGDVVEIVCISVGMRES